jgi:ATP-binding cassette subfamily B protein
VLHHLDCTIQPGQKVAIVGRSGSGKTTLVKCLAALIRPTRGSMLYDDVDAERVRHSDLRRHVGLVLNENYFFSGSVLANIAFGDPQPNAERATWAARIANAHDFIMQLSDGYQSDLDESRGVVLSNGQRQSLAIARALYRDPAILILDEATSALDIETERLIYERLAELYAKRTFIIVTHRLNLIADADQILVLNRGRLVEQGTHQDLLQRRGLYYHLIRRQVE